MSPLSRMRLLTKLPKIASRQRDCPVFPTTIRLTLRDRAKAMSSREALSAVMVEVDAPSAAYRSGLPSPPPIRCLRRWQVLTEYWVCTYARMAPAS